MEGSLTTNINILSSPTPVYLTTSNVHHIFRHCCQIYELRHAFQFCVSLDIILSVCCRWGWWARCSSLLRRVPRGRRAPLGRTHHNRASAATAWTNCPPSNSADFYLIIVTSYFSLIQQSFPFLDAALVLEITEASYCVPDAELCALIYPLHLLLSSYHAYV